MMLKKYLYLTAALLLACASVEARQYLVSYSGGAAAAANSVANAGGSVIRDFAAINVLVAQSEGVDFESVLSRQKGILDVAEDVAFTRVAPAAGTSMASAVPTFQWPGSPSVSPFNSGLFPYQWHLSRTQTDLAWGLTQGKPELKVAVVDTGICAHHQDLAGKIDTANSASFVPPEWDLCPPVPMPPCEDCPPWEDRYFHGTFVASIISTNNIGLAGVAPKVRLMAVKVVNCEGWSLTSWIVAGILHAVERGADVINLSLGGYHAKNEKTPFGPIGRLWAMETKAVNYARSRGVLVVAAAGNDGADLQHDGNLAVGPCEMGTVLCVGSTTYNDSLSIYVPPLAPPGAVGSNHGVNSPRIMAPGGGVPATSDILTQGILGACAPHGWIPMAFFGLDCARGQTYLPLSGTSFATPQVAGAAALILATDKVSQGPGRAAQIESILTRTAEDLGKPGTDNIFSHGRLNTWKAVSGK